MSNQSSLKPCPFCGGRGESMIRGQWYKIVCQNCYAESNEEPTYADAGHRWNERFNEAELKRRDDEIAELRLRIEVTLQAMEKCLPQHKFRSITITPYHLLLMLPKDLKEFIAENPEYVPTGTKE